MIAAVRLLDKNSKRYLFIFPSLCVSRVEVLKEWVQNIIYNFFSFLKTNFSYYASLWFVRIGVILAP